MILRIIKGVTLFIIFYLSICSYKEEAKIQKFQFEHKHSYHRQIIRFNRLWNDEQFQLKNQDIKTLQFKINQKQEQITLIDKSKQDNNQFQITYKNLEIETEDAKQIQSIHFLDANNKIVLLKSKFFTLIYSTQNKNTCYEKIGLSNSIESYFVDSSLNLWIFSHPNNNILLLRLYNCQNNELLSFQKYATEQKIQFITELKENKNTVGIKLLTFSRNYLQYEFDLKKFNIVTKKKIQTHSFDYFEQQINQISTKLNKKTQQIQLGDAYQDFFYKISFGLFGKLSTQLVERQKQQNYDLDAFDCDKNIIVKFDENRNSSDVVGFGSVLLPFRTPVFINKDDQEKLIPFDQILNKSRVSNQMPMVDFKLYGIKSKNLQIMKRKSGLYRLLPDAKVQFMGFDNKFLTFYPKQNINQQQYYIVRTATGGIAMKGNQIKGIFQELPVSNSSAVQLKNGYMKDEVYHQHTTNGQEVLMGIYEAHAIHKGLFVYPRKNRIDLITSLSGKSLLSHYLSIKSGYEYSTSYIENNQFWVFEHKAGEQPIITKYELFVNSSSPKALLSIKRVYEVPVIGKITRVQKCIDYFYYFTYVTDTKKYGIARIHHALMSNRQALPDQKYSGTFEKMMVIPNLQRNTKIKVTETQQQLLLTQFNIGSQVISNWKQLELKHQYKILPIRVYSYKNEYYIINLRKIGLNAFDNKVTDTRNSIYTQVLTVTLPIGLLIVVSLIMTKQSSRKTQLQKSSKQNKKFNQDTKKNKKQ